MKVAPVPAINREALINAVGAVHLCIGCGGLGCADCGGSGARQPPAPLASAMRDELNAYLAARGIEAAVTAEGRFVVVELLEAKGTP